MGTSDRTGPNSLKLVHSLLKSGHDRKIDQKWNNAMYQDDFCDRNCELLSRRFLHKSQIYKYITPQIIAIFLSRSTGPVPVTPEEGMGIFSRNLSFSIPPSEPVIWRYKFQAFHWTKSWIDKVPAKYRCRKSDSKRQNNGKDTHALPRSDRDWRRVVAIEVMQLSGDNVCEKLGFLKETSKK